MALANMTSKINGRTRDRIGHFAVVGTASLFVTMFAVALSTGNNAKEEAQEAQFDADVAQIQAGAADIKAGFAYQASINGTGDRFTATDAKALIEMKDRQDELRDLRAEGMIDLACTHNPAASVCQRDWREEIDSLQRVYCDTIPLTGICFTE